MYTNNYNDDYNDTMYLKSIYPESVLSVHKYISDYCDKMEHANSAMYDEFPDKARIRSIAIEVCGLVEFKNVYGSNSVFKDLVEILLLNEILHRRIRRRAFQ